MYFAYSKSKGMTIGVGRWRTPPNQLGLPNSPSILLSVTPKFMGCADDGSFLELEARNNTNGTSLLQTTKRARTDGEEASSVTKTFRGAIMVHDEGERYPMHFTASTGFPTTERAYIQQQQHSPVSPVTVSPASRQQRKSQVQGGARQGE